MTAAFSAVLALILILTVPVKTGISIRIRPRGIYARIVPRLLFGMLPVTLKMDVFLRYPDGLMLRTPSGRIKPLPPRKKPIGKIDPGIFAAGSITVSGTVGIRNAPDKSAEAAGALGILASAAVPALLGIKPDVLIEPCFSHSVFALNVEGIVKAKPGKIIIETIKRKRRG